MSGAIISDCGQYRYRLERDHVWPVTVAVVMVNPSTADAATDDATIRKLKGFGQRHQWGRIIVGNLFAYRATDVRKLATAPDPIGRENNDHLIQMFAEAHQVIIAWGPLAKQPRLYRNRCLDVLALIDGAGLDPYCIGAPAKDGQPRHPLMLAYAEPIQRWSTPV
jgi:hypothetical protein